MSRRQREICSNAILSSAIYAGLASLVRLSRKRVNKKTRRFFVSIEKMWAEAREQWDDSLNSRAPNFSPIQNAEPNMRGMFLKILWHSTRRFGNKEFKRVYSWLEGTVGPLNALLNYAGARLRDLAMTKYVFPKPEFFQIREYPDGTKNVFPKKTAEQLPEDDAVKKYWRAGYSRRGKVPRVFLSHPTLPGLDFVDMIRAHLVELCRQCFIHNVPMYESHRYIRLLIHNLRPFLDWVYSEGEMGQPYFNPNSDHELRKVVLEMRSLYGRRAGRRKSVTRGHDSDPVQLDTKLLKKRVVELLENASNEDEQKLYATILEHINDDVVVDRDIEKLVEFVQALNRREGNDWHRVLLSDLHHPKSLNQVIYAGDNMLDEPSSVLVVGELPVARRKGQIDIVVFIRREIPGRVVWTPVMILEVKTKTSFDFNLYGVRTRNKKKKDYATAFYAWKRTMTEEEWEATITSDPLRRTIRQLDAYEPELLQEYRQLVSLDPTPPRSLWKGVVVLDTDQNPPEVFEAFQLLLEDLTMGLVHDMLDTSGSVSYSPVIDHMGEQPRVAVLFPPSKGPVELLNECVVPESVPVEDPFSERVSDEQSFTLYVSVPSPTSSGQTAAWISRNWHLLNHIQECIETSTTTKRVKVYWLDLAGDFQSRSLTRRRFGLDTLLEEGRIDKRQHRTLDGLLDRINFIDLSVEVEQVLTDSGSGLESLTRRVSSVNNDTQVERIIVVDGWVDFRDMVPSNRHQLVRAVEASLLDTLPDSETNVIWIDSGVAHTRMNRHYQRRCISPLPHDSPRRTRVDEIIYNVPTPPRTFSRLTPQREDVRLIIQDVQGKTPSWKTTIYVPHLKDFTRRFRGLARREPTVTEDEVFRGDDVPCSMYGRQVKLSSIHTQMSPLSKDEVSQLEDQALTLIPSVLRPRGEDREEQARPERAPSQLVTHTVTAGGAFSLTERMTLRPELPPPRPPRLTKRYVAAKGITRGWHYDRAPSRHLNDDDESCVVRRPALVRPTPDSAIDGVRTRELELRRILRAAQFVKARFPIYKSIHECCASVIQVCLEALTQTHDGDRLLNALKSVRDIILSDQDRIRVWEATCTVRLGLPELLEHENRAALKLAMLDNPDILFLYGNNLFLAVLAVLGADSEETPVSHAVQLWSSVVEWELSQMGFKVIEEPVRSKYDLRAIYSNLMFRVRTLPTLRVPESQVVDQYAGQLVWMESEDGPDAWLVFQSERGMVAGLIEGATSQWLRAKYYPCANEPERLRSSARCAHASSERNSIVVTTVNDQRVLWIKVETEDSEEWVPWMMDYGFPPKGETLPIRWVKLSEPPLDVYSHLIASQPAVGADAVEKSVNKVLEQVASLDTEVVSVECHVSVDAKRQVYEVKFIEDSLIERLEFRATDELVRVLRQPFRTGEGLRSRSRKTMMWDHLKDIAYTELKLRRGGKEEMMSLTFLRPLVHRSRFFPEEYHYPRTCSDLLATRMGDKIELVIRPHEDSFWSLRVRLDDVPEGSPLKDLEEVDLTIFDVGLLAECEQLIDTSAGIRHDVEIDAVGIADIVFYKSSDYPRLEAAFEVADLTEFDWSRESWTIGYRLRGDELSWWITSGTGRQWMKRTFVFKLHTLTGIEEVVDDFKSAVMELVPLEHLSGLDGVLRAIRNELRERGGGDEPARCRLDLECGVGGYAMVISRIEREGLTEVERIPIEVNSETLEVDLDALSEGIDTGVLSMYNIVNELEFWREVRRAAEESEQEEEALDEEAERLKVIEEYREEVVREPEKSVLLGKNLTQLARHRFDQGRLQEALESVEEAIGVLEGCGLGDMKIKRQHIKALVLRIEMVLSQDDADLGVVREWIAQTRVRIEIPAHLGEKLTGYQDLIDRVNELEEKLEELD